MISIHLFLVILMFQCFNARPQCPKKMNEQKDSPNLISIFSPKNFIIASLVKSKDGSLEITDVFDFSKKQGYITVKNGPNTQSSITKRILYDSNSMTIQSDGCVKENLDKKKIFEVIFGVMFKEIPISSLFKDILGPVGILHSINDRVFLAEVLDSNKKIKQKWVFCGDRNQNDYKITFNPEDLDKFVGKEKEVKAINQVDGGKKFLSFKITGLKSGQDVSLHFFKYEPTNQDTIIPDCDNWKTNEDSHKRLEERSESENGSKSDQNSSKASTSGSDDSKNDSRKYDKSSNSPEQSENPQKKSQKPHSGSEPKASSPSTDTVGNNGPEGKKSEKQADKNQLLPDKVGGKSLPKFVPFLPQRTESEQSSNFKIDMKAVYVKSFQDGRKRLTSRASISYADDVFTLQTFSNHLSDVNRLIYDKNFNLLYTINLENGECSIEYVPLAISSKPNLPGYRWPQFEDLFNLLNLDLWIVEHKETTSLKTEELNGKNYDVFQRLVSNFYVGPRNAKARATYYFDSNNAGKPPVKVLIEPMENEISFYEPKIQLDIENFTENPENDYDRFDLSACYKNPGSYRWVQFTIDNVSPEADMDYKKMELLFRKSLHESLSIPRIRIGQIGVNLWAPKVYIAAQLIEHPDFQFLYSFIAEKRVKQATQVYTLESVRDCADICIDSNKGCSFSYCEDKKCHIQILTDKKELHRKTDLIDDKLCQTYLSLQKFEAQPGYKHRSSTRALITDIIEKRDKIVLSNGNEDYKDPNMTINVLNGPDDLLGPYLKTPLVILADQFQITRKGYKIRKQILEKFDDKTYRRCLDACNDREDCHSISHCSDNICILSSGQNIGDNSDEIELDAKCSISSRLYINRFDKISDQKLKRTAEKTYFSIGKEKCAQICSVDETDCLSFDHCESYQENGGDVKRSCILHNAHATKEKVDSESSMDGEQKLSICGHYSKKVSRDFVQNFGTKFDDKKGLQSRKDFQSQESCAFECFSRECIAFEFCRKLDKNKQLPEFRCRISEIDGEADREVELLKPETLKDDKDCSTFLHRDLFKVKKRETIESVSFNFAFFISLLAILTGLGLAIFFAINKRQNEFRHIETSF